MAKRIKNVFKRMGIAIMKSRMDHARRQLILHGYPEVVEFMKEQKKEH